MKWWHVLVILLDSYLLLSLGPWIALQMLDWLMGRSRWLLIGEGRLRELSEMEQEQRRSWPQKPRPGRYEEPDRVALESLATLQSLIAEAGRLWPLVGSYSLPVLSFVDVLSLRSWRVLPGALAAWRNMRSLLRLLDQGDQLLATLIEQQQVIEDIPARVRAALNDMRAEVQRLSAILEMEEEAGTAGLEAIAQRLEERERAIEQALDALAEAAAERLPAVIAEIDELLPSTGIVLSEIDQFLGRVTEERNKAQSLIQRVESSLRLAEERWEGLKLRGATEPTLSRGLAELKSGLERAKAVAKERSVNAYQQVTAQVAAMDSQVAALLEKLDALDEAMEQSKKAVEGDVSALAKAQAMCDELARQDPLLELDQSLALIERASQAYMEAERQRGLGTFQGYEASLAEAETAMKYLGDAQEALKQLPERVRQIREDLGALAAEATGDWRRRAERVREQLRLYTRHWNAGLAGDAAEAIACLDQVEVDLERVPPNVRYQRRFRQSELAEAAEILSHARQEMEKAKSLITSLEAEQRRIERLRAELASALDKLKRESIPELERLKDKMLPELQERLAAFLEAFQKQAVALEDPAQVNYDESVTQWLPSIWQQVDELRAEHERSLREYAQALKEATQRLERQWARLNELNPQESPSSEEKIERLARDLEEWFAEAQRRKDNPLFLRDIVGRRAAALEQRIEVARQQVVEGRRLLDSLSREYLRRLQAVQRLRESLKAMQRDSRWPQLAWSTEEAERMWERASEWERKSRAAPDLMSAGDQLQQAVSVAQQAEQLFARVERQMDSALGRLDSELKAVVSALERAKRRAERIRKEGPSEELTDLEARCAAAERAIALAEAATTFEDALRHLRAARESLA